MENVQAARQPLIKQLIDIDAKAIDTLHTLATLEEVLFGPQDISTSTPEKLPPNNVESWVDSIADRQSYMYHLATRILERVEGNVKKVSDVKSYAKGRS